MTSKKCSQCGIEKPIEEPTKETPVISEQTPANENPIPNKKIFGMSRKVVIGGGIGLILIGVTAFFLLKKKKKYFWSKCSIKSKYFDKLYRCWWKYYW